MAARGRFITFEGGEGAGKSTQARLLADRLRETGRRIVLTREPGGSPFAEHLRALILDPATPPHGPLSETLLFYAARADHIAETIRPALGHGRWVISDRFSDSTRVYQGSAGRVDRSAIETLERLVVDDCRPDMTVVMDLAPEIGLARAAERLSRAAAAAGRKERALQRDIYEARALDFHARLRDGFLEIARAEPDRCIIVDATRPEAEIAAEIWAAVEARLLRDDD